MKDGMKIRTLHINLEEWNQAMKILIDIGTNISQFIRTAVKKLIADNKKLSKKDFQDKYMDNLS